MGFDAFDFIHLSITVASNYCFIENLRTFLGPFFDATMIEDCQKSKRVASHKYCNNKKQ